MERLGKGGWIGAAPIEVGALDSMVIWSNSRGLDQGGWIRL